MSDTNTCPRCDEINTLKHKFIECVYIKRIWESAKPKIEKLSCPIPGTDYIKTALAAVAGSTLASMTLTAELLQTILYLKPDPTYLVHPKALVNMAIKNLAIKEGNKTIKGDFIELINETYSD